MTEFFAVIVVTMVNMVWGITYAPLFAPLPGIKTS
jgi:hypothetical protein